MSWGTLEEGTKHTLNMAICYCDGTWESGFLVEVEDEGECCNGDECCHVLENYERLEKQGAEAIFKRFPKSKDVAIKTPGRQIVSVWLYLYSTEY